MKIDFPMKFVLPDGIPREVLIYAKNNYKI